MNHLSFGSTVRSFWTGRTRGSRARVWVWTVLTSLMLIVLTGASDPEVIGVRGDLEVFSRPNRP
jgi:hypothetical protein